MKNEKEIWLNPEEIKQLLEGGLYWKDIETKLSPADAEGFRRNLKKEDLSIEDIIWEPHLNKFQPEILKQERDEEGNQVRAILLGEDNVIKDRQIDLSFIKVEKELASVPLAAVEEEPEIRQREDILYEVNRVDFEEEGDKDFQEVYKEDSAVKDDEMNAFSNIVNKHFDDEAFMMELENKGTPFGGLKLIVLLVVTAVITFGCWYYFLSG